MFEGKDVALPRYEYSNIHIREENIWNIHVHGAKVGILANLSGDSQRRYECKVISSSLSTDPYAIDNGYWTDAPEIVPQ